MITNRWIIATALVLSIHMILQCSGKTTSIPSQTEKYNTKLQETEPNVTNQPLATTTVSLVNPYIFSGDDYDVLQDAESLQQTLSIVAYEPQKIDVKRAKNISKTIDIFEESTQPLYTTTQLPSERTKYYGVPQKHSNVQTHRKQEKKSMKVGASKLVQETLSPKQTHEKVRDNAWQHETYHRTNNSPTTQFPSPRSLTKDNQDADAVSPLPSLPFYFSLSESTPTEPYVDTQSNYSLISKYNTNKVDQAGSETSKSEVDAAIIRKKQHKTESNHPMQKKSYYQLPQPTILTATSDRVPRPFSLPTECNPVARTLTHPTRTTSIRQNTQLYPTAYARQNIAPPTVPKEHAAASSIISLQHNIRPITPAKPEQLKYSRNLSNRDRTVTYSRVPTKPEPSNAYQTFSFNHNPTPQNIAIKRLNNHATSPAELSFSRSVVQATKEQPIAYSITRRPEQKIVRSTPLSRQGQVIAPSTVFPIREKVEVYSTIPTRQNYVPTNLNIPKEHDSTLIYQTSPRRRKIIRNHLPKEQTEIRSSVPIEQAIANSNSVAKQKVIPEEQNLGHPTIIQPTYTSIPPESANQRGETKYNSPMQENNDDKDYSNNDSYNDSNESNSNGDDSDDDVSKNSNNHYSYNYNERYEEPLDEEPRKYNNAYKVKEEIIEQPEHEPKRLKIDTNHHRETHKKTYPDYEQDHAQYVDLQSTEQDSDYDQSRGQNKHHDVAEHQVQQAHRSKGDEEDLAEEADHQHKKHHKPEKHEEEEEHSADGHENEHHLHGEKGTKGYKQFHEHDKGEKGHHDKEGHDHHYDEKEGKDKEHHEVAGFHEEYEKGEEGEKKTAFKEKGDHKKGHSTKGEHVIHKKDEFEKKTEFFDEFHEGGDIDKDGGYHEEHHHKKGGYHKKGHHHEGEQEKKHGEKGKFNKGHHHHEKKGHNEHEGHDQHYHHEEKHGKKGAHEDAKKWSNKKGNKR